MAQDKWLNPAGGDFATASDWSTGAVPGVSDDALLTTAGTYTVTSSASETVNSIQIVQHVTLSITGGTFTATNGSGAGSLSGLIAMGDATGFVAGGTIAGAGTIAMTGTYYGATFQVEGASTTLSGGGKLLLSDNAQNYVNAAVAGGRLINASDTIAGSGQLGQGVLAITNSAAGVIDATGTNAALALNVGTYGVSNAGLIESTGPAGLYIQGGSTITQTGTGTIKGIGLGNNVYLNGAVVVGGTLATASGGGIVDISSAELNGLKVATGAAFSSADDTTLLLDNAITNQGTITQNGTYYGTNLIINTSTVTLNGGGKLVLGDSGSQRVYGTALANKLVNVNNIISGSGQFGNGTLTFDNQAAGVLNSNGLVGMTVNTGGGAFTNEGLIEDTGVGGLGFDGTTVTNTATIAANGAGSTVELYNGASIIGGMLSTTGGGLIESIGDGTLDGSTSKGAVTITGGSTVQLNDDTGLELNGSIINDGTISGIGTYYGTNLVINTATVTLSGGGQVDMLDNGSNRIYGQTLTDKLVNINNTFAGSGQFGDGQLTVDNQALGVIDSTGASGLTINTGGGAFTNEGLIENTNTGGLGLDAVTILNTGTIASDAAGGGIYLYNNASIEGGAVKSVAGAVIESAGNGTLDGTTNGAITITAGSTVQLVDDTNLELDGSIVNRGTISQIGTYYGTTLFINTGTVTLNGGGKVVLADNGTNRIEGAAVGDTLVNANNTISGSGQLGNGQLTLINDIAGVIDSTGTAGLTINDGGSGGVTNAGLIEDTNIGGLGIDATSITNTGTIAAKGAGSSVNIYAGASIVGGTLVGTGGGVFETTGNGTLDGSTAIGAITIDAGAVVELFDDTQMELNGAIVNDGSFNLLGTYYGSTLFINTPTVTLSGGGDVVLADNGTNRIEGAAPGNLLVNVDNTISGSGQLGNGQLAFDNQAAGIVDSNGASGLTINSGGGTTTNEGLIEDTSTGGIGIYATTIVNTGTIAAYGAGTSVNIYGGASVAGGTIASSGGGVIVTTSAGTLDGSAHALTVATGTTVETFDGTNLAIDGTITNRGAILLQGTYYGSTLFINSPTVTLNGGGSVVLLDDNNNRIQAATAGNKLVNAANTISGAGYIGNGGSLLLDNQKLGVIDATGANALVVNLAGATFTNEGLAEGSGSGGLFIQNTTLTNTGTIASLSDSSATIDSSNTVTNYTAGTLTNGTWEAISAGGTDTSTLTIAAGTISVDAAHLVISGAGATILAGGTSVVSTIKTITSKGELDIQNGATVSTLNALTLGGELLLNGSLSAASINIQSTGTINADGGVAKIETTAKVTNAGLIEATSGTLELLKGTLTNTGSVIAQGAVLDLVTAEKTTNYAAGTLTGGNWQAIGSGATLTIGVGTIAVDAATLTLSGAGSAIDSGSAGVSLENTLGTIATSGILDVLNGRGFTSTISTGVIDAGTITLGGGSFGDHGLSIDAGATFQGGGTVSGVVTDNGTLTSAAVTGGNGTLTVTAAISGTGLLHANTVTDLIASAGFAVGSLTVASAGTIAGAGSVTHGAAVGGVLTLGTAGTLSAGSVTVQTGGVISGASIIASGPISDSGTINLSGGTLSGTTITVTSGASLIGGGSVLKTVANSGTIDATGTLTLEAGESGGVLQAADGGSLVSTTAFAAASLSIAAGGTISGAGSLSGAATVDGVLALGKQGTLTAASLTVQADGSVSGAGIATTGTIGDSGTISLSGGTLSGSSITVATTTAALSGYGIVAKEVANSGTITATGGTLTLKLGETGGTLKTMTAGAGVLVASAAVAASNLSVQSGSSFTGSGSISVSAVDNGTVTVSSGTLTLATATGTGIAVISNAAALQSTTALKVGGGLTFAAGSGETLALGTPSGNTAVITGFASGTTIDLLNTIVTSLGYGPATGTLALKNGGTDIGTLKFAGSYSQANFGLMSDGHAGTDIVFAATDAIDPIADLQSAVVAVAASSQATELVTAAYAPAAALQTSPTLDVSLNFNTAPHALDGMTLHQPPMQQF